MQLNVYDVVSVKLSGRSNYDIWKDQMVCLLQSHGLLHIIDKEARSPRDEDSPMTEKYDSLVRGWILSTMNAEERHRYRIYRSVKLMWSNIESTFDETEDRTHIDALNVNVSNFVSVNLLNENNYSIWRAQMLYLLEFHGLFHIINGTYFKEEQKYHRLVKGWILCTMNDKLLKEFSAEDFVNDSAKYLWEKLELGFKKGYSRLEPVVSASTQDLKYTQAINVNVSNFVSVKLSRRNNYEIWKAQMLCLIESQKLLHIIDKGGDNKVDKYETLVKGWIFSTMHEQLLKDLKFTDNGDISLKSAEDLWKELRSAFNPPKDAQEFEFGKEFIKDCTEIESDLPESDNTEKKRWSKAVAERWWRKAKSIFKINKNVATEATTANDNTILHIGVEGESPGKEVVRDIPDTESIKKELYIAAAKGWWRKAKSILKNGEIAATEAINGDGNTILHVAVKMGHNYFIEELLEFLQSGEDIEKRNKKGQTALHIAAMVGNTQAAQVLVQKREELLAIEDNDKNSPLHLASKYTNLNTYEYLFSIDSDHNYSCFGQKPALLAAIYSKQYGQ